MKAVHFFFEYENSVHKWKIIIIIILKEPLACDSDGGVYISA